MPRVRGATLAVPLPDGRVLVGPRWGVFSDYRTLGGDRRGFRKPTSALLEIYDPATGTFRLAGSAPGAATSATLLRTGKVLLAGHVADLLKPTVRTWAATFDPERGVTELTASPLAPFAVSARLADGRVLFAGGFVGPDRGGGGWPPRASGSLEIFE